MDKPSVKNSQTSKAKQKSEDAKDTTLKSSKNNVLPQKKSNTFYSEFIVYF
jgi:hypothetical protein